MKLIYHNNITDLVTDLISTNFTDELTDNFVTDDAGNSTSNQNINETIEIEHLKANCTADKDFNGPDEAKNSTNSCDTSDEMGF